jgi:hypothetical protein
MLKNRKPLIPTVYPKNFWKFVDKKKGNECWIWKGKPNNSGYGTANFRGKFVGAHRVSYILNIGKIPEKMSVLHHCDIKMCVRPDHLFLGTQKDNIMDMIKKGRNLCGEKHNMAKLNENKVREIRRKMKAGINYKIIANEFKICKSHVFDIASGKKWKHVI